MNRPKRYMLFKCTPLLLCPILYAKDLPFPTLLNSAIFCIKFFPFSTQTFHHFPFYEFTYFFIIILLLLTINFIIFYYLLLVALYLYITYIVNGNCIILLILIDWQETILL